MFLTEPTTLVFNEMYFPGWKASIDRGPRVPMLEVAGGLRALRVEAGFHRIETRFSPGVFWVGFFITAAAWLGVLAYARLGPAAAWGACCLAALLSAGMFARFRATAGIGQ